MPPTPIIAPADLPRDVVAGIDEIRRHNPQRHEMEQLTAVTLLDEEHTRAVGYKDMAENEFWVRGHIPGFPILPGVLMCEAAAQLCSFYCMHFGLLKADFIGFGGIDDVRFRGTVRPGQRLWIVAQALKISHRRVICEAQEFVEDSMVFNGQIIGVPIKTNEA